MRALRTSSPRPRRIGGRRPVASPGPQRGRGTGGGLGERPGHGRPRNKRTHYDGSPTAGGKDAGRPQRGRSPPPPQRRARSRPRGPNRPRGKADAAKGGTRARGRPRTAARGRDHTREAHSDQHRGGEAAAATRPGPLAPHAAARTTRAAADQLPDQRGGRSAATPDRVRGGRRGGAAAQEPQRLPGRARPGMAR